MSAKPHGGRASQNTGREEEVVSAKPHVFAGELSRGDTAGTNDNGTWSDETWVFHNGKRILRNQIMQQKGGMENPYISGTAKQSHRRIRSPSREDREMNYKRQTCESPGKES